MDMICTPYAQKIFENSQAEDDGESVTLTVDSSIVADVISACFLTETGKDIAKVGSETTNGFPPN